MINSYRIYGLMIEIAVENTRSSQTVPENLVQFLAWSSGLVSKPGETALTDRRRGEAG